MTALFGKLGICLVASPSYRISGSFISPANSVKPVVFLSFEKTVQWQLLASVQKKVLPFHPGQGYIFPLVRYSIFMVDLGQKD